MVFTRTVIRVIKVKKQIVYSIISGWDYTQIVKFPLEMVPEDIQPLLVPNFRFFAKVNIDAEDISDLQFKDFELGKS